MTFVTTPSRLFSLKDFQHAALFEECAHAWEALERLEAYLNSQLPGQIAIEIPKGVHLVNSAGICIGKGTVIESGAYIQGPCILGENCVVRHGAYIRGNVLAGDGVVIGHGTEVKHSIFLNNACAAHLNYVGDSILGAGVNLGAGAKCANLRLDRSFVSVWIEGKCFPTGLKKLGAVLGDGVQIGCNCVLNPGTVFGKNGVCFPCLNVCGFIPENIRVKPGMKNIME